jgi:hypothetical protein
MGDTKPKEFTVEVSWAVKIAGFSAPSNEPLKDIPALLFAVG